MFLLFRGYPVEFTHSIWLYRTMSRPFICLPMQMNIIGSPSKENAGALFKSTAADKYQKKREKRSGKVRQVHRKQK